MLGDISISYSSPHWNGTNQCLKKSLAILCIRYSLINFKKNVVSSHRGQTRYTKSRRALDLCSERTRWVRHSTYSICASMMLLQAIIVNVLRYLPLSLSLSLSICLNLCTQPHLSSLFLSLLSFSPRRSHTHPQHLHLLIFTRLIHLLPPSSHSWRHTHVHNPPPQKKSVFLFLTRYWKQGTRKC